MVDLPYNIVIWYMIVWLILTIIIIICIFTYIYIYIYIHIYIYVSMHASLCRKIGILTVLTMPSGARSFKHQHSNFAQPHQPESLPPPEDRWMWSQNKWGPHKMASLKQYKPHKMNMYLWWPEWPEVNLSFLYHSLVQSVGPSPQTFTRKFLVSQYSTGKKTHTIR